MDQVTDAWTDPARSGDFETCVAAAPGGERAGSLSPLALLLPHPRWVTGPRKAGHASPPSLAFRAGDVRRCVQMMEFVGGEYEKESLSTGLRRGRSLVSCTR